MAAAGESYTKSSKLSARKPLGGQKGSKILKTAALLLLSGLEGNGGHVSVARAPCWVSIFSHSLPSSLPPDPRPRDAEIRAGRRTGDRKSVV